MFRKYIPKKRFLAIAVLVGALSFGFVPNVSAPVDNYFEISKNLDIFGKLYREVNAYYVDDIDPAKFMRSGIDAMLKSLDPYTNFISASEIEDYRFMSTGQYGGIGAMINKKGKDIVISEPYKGFPAAKSGLRAGDVIIKIDEEEIKGKDVPTLDVRNLLRGQAETAVKLTIERYGVAEPLELEVVREEIKIKNVPYYGMIDKEVGYISLTGFTRDAAKEVKHGLETLKKENAGLKGIVLDLRGNPGGLLFESVDISNLFVDQGATIVETRGKMEGSLNTYKAKYPPIDKTVPLAVLINRRSASASEIVSGTMQDLDRGVILGERSFGKGLVQTTRPLSYNSQMKITTAKYYTPSGRCIQAINYSERNDDGSVARIPDSLKKEFKTTRGRSVYDGGGIEPDIEVKIPDFHSVTVGLITQDLIFDFATVYRSKRDSIPSSREFRITDQIYNEFKQFVRGKNFVFETKTEKEMAKLVDLLKEEKYYDDLEGDLKNLEKSIHREKDNDLDTFRKEISHVLRSEIISRYYYRSGEVESSFDDDPVILEATKVLKNQQKYQQMLSGSN